MEINKNNINRIKELKESLNETYKKCFQEYHEQKEKYKDEMLKVFNFEKKYLKFFDRYEREVYMFCDWITHHNDSYDGDRDLLYFSGYGFTYEFTPYNDSTYVQWDELFQTEMDISENVDIEKEFSKIEIITEDEYNSVFDKMIDKLKEHHKKQLENIKS